MNSLGGYLLQILCSYPFQLLIAMHLFAYPTFKRRGRFWLRAVFSALPVLIGFELSVVLYPAGIIPGEPFLDRALLLIPTVWYYGMLLFCYECTPRRCIPRPARWSCKTPCTMFSGSPCSPGAFRNTAGRRCGCPGG